MGEDMKKTEYAIKQVGDRYYPVIIDRDVLLGAEHAVALVKERAVRGERSLEFDRVNVYHLREGKIVEIWCYDSDAYALDEF